MDWLFISKISILRADREKLIDVINMICNMNENHIDFDTSKKKISIEYNHRYKIFLDYENFFIEEKNHEAKIKTKRNADKSLFLKEIDLYFKNFFNNIIDNELTYMLTMYIQFYTGNESSNKISLFIKYMNCLNTIESTTFHSFLLFKKMKEYAPEGDYRKKQEKIVIDLLDYYISIQDA